MALANPAQARLHRFVRLNDRFDSHVFTFLLPHTLLRDYEKETFICDFQYGHQKWTAIFNRHDKHIGAFLRLKHSYRGQKFVLDYGFSTVNKEHYSKNEGFVDKACEFTMDNNTHGRKNFIGCSDLQDRHFRMDTGEFMVELELRGIRTFFEEIIQLPKEGKDSNYGYRKLETTIFTFGSFDWSLAVYPHGDRPENENRPIAYLIRQTSFDHLCRVRYKLSFGQGEKMIDTDIIEQTLDASGFGDGCEIGSNLYKLSAHKSRLRVSIELLWVSAVSEVKLSAFDRNNNVAHLYDRDKQAWLLQTDINRQYLVLKLYYSDINNVPRNKMRYVSWNACVMPLSRRLGGSKATEGPHGNYYTQGQTDKGYEMNTRIPVVELNEPGNPYLDDEDILTIQIEWLDSHLLHHGSYHCLDDVNNKHRHQMRREILALQAENFALEKQLHSYQLSISRNHGKEARGRHIENDWNLGEASTSTNSF